MLTVNYQLSYPIYVVTIRNYASQQLARNNQPSKNIFVLGKGVGIGDLDTMNSW